jgi:hypothetical protein
MPMKRLCTTQDFVPEGLLNYCEVLRSTVPKIGTKFDTHSLFLSLINRKNRHRSLTRLQIKACGNYPRPISKCNLAHLLTRHGSPTVYRYFALPQLMYRRRHQSEIFWIPPRITSPPPVAAVAITAIAGAPASNLSHTHTHTHTHTTPHHTQARARTPNYAHLRNMQKHSIQCIDISSDYLVH